MSWRFANNSQRTVIGIASQHQAMDAKRPWHGMTSESALCVYATLIRHSSESWNPCRRGSPKTFMALLSESSASIKPWVIFALAKHGLFAVQELITTAL